MNDSSLRGYGDGAIWTPIEIKGVGCRALFVELCECGRRVISAEGLFGDDNVRGREVFFEDIAAFIVCQPRLQANVTAQASERHCNVCR